MTSPNPAHHRRRWSLRRFLDTASYFSAIPLIGNLNCLRRMLGQPSIASNDHTARLKQSAAVLVLGSERQFAIPMIESLTRLGYRVKWLSFEAEPAAVRDVEVAQADRTRPGALPLGFLKDVDTIIGCPTTAEVEVIVPWLEALLGAGSNGALGSRLDRSGSLLFDFTQPDARFQDWGALDDVVMGGVSESGLRPALEGAVFAGNVSTANSGGFASVRTRNFSPPLNLSGCTGLELRVKGDGNRYKLMLRSESAWDSLAYAASFDTPFDTWTTVQIPFTELRPVFRARTVSTANPIDPSRIHALQLMLSKFEYDGSLNPHFTPGAFQLTLASIQTYGSPVTPSLVLALPVAEGTAVADDALLQFRLRQIGLPFALFQFGSLLEGSGAQMLMTVQANDPPGGIYCGDLVQLCGAAIAHPRACGVTATVASGQGVCPPGDWDCLFSRML